MSTHRSATPEFSRFVAVDGLTAKGRTFVAAADDRERASLARRFALQALDKLEVVGEVTSIRGGTVVRLSARLSAEVTQTCVVSLAPVVRRIETDFVRLFAADAAEEAVGGEEIFFDRDQDDIDPHYDNRIDVGEAAAEQLALELDPYPRVPDVRLEDIAGPGRDAHPDAESRKPFAALARLVGDGGVRKARK
jgi:uncharacterized metal-binding protein YceD (DUF177 family)